MKLWIDDVRPAPPYCKWCKSVNQAKVVIQAKEDMIQSCSDQAYMLERNGRFEMAQKIGRVVKESTIELIDIDHDAGDYASEGGHYIKLLEWLEETGRNYPIHIHSDNQINLLWMREIIKRNGWVEV